MTVKELDNGNALGSGERMKLTTDPKVRKGYPLATGCLDYFPDALCEVAEVSRIGNDQHNPGEPLQWAKEKSADHDDSLLRHMVDRGTRDKDGSRHRAKVAWRALAALQIEIEEERKLEQQRVDKSWVDAASDPHGLIYVHDTRYHPFL